MKTMPLAICLFFAFVSNLSAQHGDFPKLAGAYLGQKPPGDTPELFAPGIVATCFEHSSAVFSKDATELFFCRFKEGLRDPSILWTKEVNGQWTSPVEICAAEGFSELTPFLSFDENRLFFTSTNRGDDNCGKSKRPASIFWKAERNEQGWSEPECLHVSVPNEIQKDGISITDNGILYFWALYRLNGTNQADLFRYNPAQEGSTQPEPLSETINSRFAEGFSFISPDESYIIISSFREGGHGMSDLYISYRNKNGVWTAPINMGSNINSPAKDGFPFISRDGKYLFFCSSRISELNSKPISETSGNIFWVSAGIIEKLRPKE